MAAEVSKNLHETATPGRAPGTAAGFGRAGNPLRRHVFAQGISEPTEGLIAQPVRSLLKSWGQTTAQITTFSALLALPWSLKPLYGLLTDFVPLAGTRRRSYLLLTSAITAAALLYLYAVPPAAGRAELLLVLLLIPTTGIAFSDVLVDALMVETGQPRGLTGRLQSVQWAAMYLATILAGSVGGLLSQRGQQQSGFLICGLAALVTFGLTLWFVEEPVRRTQRVPLRSAVASLWDVWRSPGVWSTGLFLFLWNFNPFNTAVLHLHMTGELGLSQQFYGNTVSLVAAAAVVASIAYGFYCRRVPFPILIHLSIVLGIVSTLAYCWLDGPRSAVLISLAVGFTYMTASLVQFDLAARVCRPATAGTTFAVLMALSNLGMSLSTAVGGRWYERWGQTWDPRVAFQWLVAVGAASTAACWLLVPVLRRSQASYEQSVAGETDSVG